jgi:hypothetical protein
MKKEYITSCHQIERDKRGAKLKKNSPRNTMKDGRKMRAKRDTYLVQFLCD